MLFPRCICRVSEGGNTFRHDTIGLASFQGYLGLPFNGNTPSQFLQNLLLDYSIAINSIFILIQSFYVEFWNFNSVFEIFSLYSSLVLIFVCNATFIFSGILNFQSDGLPEPMLSCKWQGIYFSTVGLQLGLCIGIVELDLYVCRFQGSTPLWIFYPGFGSGIRHFYTDPELQLKNWRIQIQDTEHKYGAHWLVHFSCN